LYHDSKNSEQLKRERRVIAHVHSSDSNKELQTFHSRSL
jgi:hypothetical protein